MKIIGDTFGDHGKQLTQEIHRIFLLIFPGLKRILSSENEHLGT